MRSFRSITNSCLSVALVTLVAPSALHASGVSGHGLDPASVERLAREHLRVIDEGDGKSRMDLVNRDPAVNSAVRGETWHGWDAIKAQSESSVPTSKVMRSVVTKIEVVPIGANVVHALTDFRSERRQVDDTKAARFVSAMTLVVLHMPQCPSVIHEHVNVRIPTEAIDFSKLKAEE